MTEFFVSTTYSPNAAVAASGVHQPVQMSPEMQFEANPVVQGEALSPSVVDWQAEETDLLPSLGVERARELLMWLINLELRLPPYSEVSPAR